MSAAIAVALILLITSKPERVQWEYTFLSSSAGPGGSKAVLDYMRLRDTSFVQVWRTRPRKILPHIPDSATLILASQFINPATRELDELLQWVEAGGHLYLATHSLSSKLEERIGIECLYRTDLVEVERMTVKFDNDGAMVLAPYSTLSSYLVINDTTQWTTIARTVGIDTQTVIAHRSYGKGQITMCVASDAFTNSGILKPSTRQISKHIVDDVVGPVVWSDYYRRSGDGALDVVFAEYRSWHVAWIILLSSATVYIMIAARRRQRVIPEIKPVKNSSLEFLGSIGELYWKRHDNGNLGRKISKQFREHVRRVVRVQIPMDDGRYVGHVADATGQQQDHVRDIVTRLRAVDTGWTPKDSELHQLFTDVKNFIRETT